MNSYCRCMVWSGIVRYDTVPLGLGSPSSCDVINNDDNDTDNDNEMPLILYLYLSLL